MSYEPGKMGIGEGMALVFIATFTSYFLSVWSVFIDQAATTAWLVPAVSALCFVTVFLILLFVMERVPGDLYQVSAQLLGRTGARIIALYFITAFFIDAVLTLRQFAENTLLTAIPGLDIAMITGWYALMAAIVNYFGIEPLARAAFIALPFGLTGLTILLLLLLNRFNLYNLTPWTGLGILSLLKTGITWSGSFLGIYLLPILAPAFQNVKTMRTAALLGLGLSTVFRSLTLFMYVAIFSVAVGREKVLPFFEMARLIYLNPFIQRVEPFFIVLWVIFGMTTIAIDIYAVTYLVTRLFDFPSMRPFFFPLAVIVAQLALLPSDIVTAIELNIKENTMILVLGAFVIPVILLLAVLIKGKRKSESCTIN